MKSLQELIDSAKKQGNKKIAVAAAHEAHVLEAVKSATELGITTAILVGDAEKIRSIAAEIDMDLSCHEIVDEKDITMACEKATLLVKEEKANCLMKGMVETSDILRAVLNKEKGLRTGKSLSHFAAFEVSSYHKVLFVTDAAMNIAPDFDMKKDIVINAINAANALGVKNPYVALLAAKEKVDEKMPVTKEYEKLVELNRTGVITGGYLEGPLALDNAVSLESAKIKKISSPVCGEADILVCPDIEAGNILYKSLVFLANAKNGGIIVGAAAPVILTSRADSSESKMYSIAMGVNYENTGN